MNLSTIEERLKSLLGDNIKIIELSRSQTTKLPLNLRNRFQYYQVQKETLRYILAVESNTHSLGKLAAYTKLGARLEGQLEQAIVFYMPPLPANIRFRYMRAGLPYISDDGSANLPGLLRMSLKKVGNPQTIKSKLSPLAQLIILRQLLKDDMEGKTQSEASLILQVSRTGISKALQELKHHQLCGYEKSIHFPMQSEALWIQALPFLRTPVHAQLYLKGPLRDFPSLISGECALARQSLLMAIGLPTIAISRRQYSALKKDSEIIPCTYKEDAKFILQIWNYEPTMLVQPDSKHVDSLSLILSLSDSSDERILQELNQLQLPWK